jgi:nitrate/nitrite transport system ATP-binding protein
VAHRKPAELAGGMNQAVGIARALAISPSLLLTDEPFRALDALTRGTLQDEMARLVSDTQQTAFIIPMTRTRRSCWRTASCS